MWLQVLFCSSSTLRQLSELIVEQIDSVIKVTPYLTTQASDTHFISSLLDIIRSHSSWSQLFLLTFVWV